MQVFLQIQLLCGERRKEMSDNMERDKNERLNARKIEEEEMKRELTGNWGLSM